MTQPAPALDLTQRPGGPVVLTTTAPQGPAAWAAQNRDAVRNLVAQYGHLYVRGLGLQDWAATAAVFRGLTTTLLGEREAFAPRQHFGDGVHSSTSWPANQQMCMHHELSYTLEFPGLMLFACLNPPAAGGATTVSDAAAVLEALPADLVARFEREGWMLTRTYNDEIGASWPDAFGTDDRAAVEAYCRANAIEFEWTTDGGLKTRQRRLAVVRHPVSGARCWFNQIAFLNEFTLDPDVREFLVDTYGPDGLPFTTRFGNGEPIGPEVIALINDVYTAHTLREPWQAGDLLLVDNVRCAHSREAYQGDRQVLVGLADSVKLADCAPTGGAR
ncbi:TauD/TfdA family dioxygenase [Pseudonocardia kujensis]|uniref:TauD/TfdA family dioxygenase n=1 Tax=Pseudonocardia kujensis TaxID=1128675 RepID=UPI001E43317F|nr:TauD/TfdA family dioxygenase [Pseudonocardia kujensis]MCE0765482.1 TauD/TfdA family dioxygenase [Pseudonocardia kujensis]